MDEGEGPENGEWLKELRAEVGVFIVFLLVVLGILGLVAWLSPGLL